MFRAALASRATRPTRSAQPLQRAYKTLTPKVDRHQFDSHALNAPINGKDRRKDDWESFNHNHPVELGELESGDTGFVAYNSQGSPPGAYSTTHDLTNTTQDERIDGMGIGNWQGKPKTDVDTVRRYLQVFNEQVFSGTIGPQDTSTPGRPGYRPDGLPTRGGWHQYLHPDRRRGALNRIYIDDDTDEGKLTALYNHFGYGGSAGNYTTPRV